MLKIIRNSLLLGIFTFLFSCGGNIFEKVDQRDRPDNPKERRRQAVEQGRGVGLGAITNRRKSTTYEFSTSNPMWRASLDTLEFLPLNTVDYSGGTIISDWYSENTSSGEEALKITIRFLSNEIQATSMKIIVHKRNCDNQSNCKVNLLSNDSKLIQELRTSILRKAALMEKESKNKKK